MLVKLVLLEIARSATSIKGNAHELETVDVTVGRGVPEEMLVSIELI